MITYLALGSGLVEASHQVFTIISSVATALFLGGSVIQAARKHWKMGVGSALSALAGGICLAVVVAHIVGLYQRGNQEFEQLPGGVGSSHNNRGW